MATQIFFIFVPNPGEIIQFDEHIFSSGLKPPTSSLFSHLSSYSCVCVSMYGHHVADWLVMRQDLLQLVDRGSLHASPQWKLHFLSWEPKGLQCSVYIRRMNAWEWWFLQQKSRRNQQSSNGSIDPILWIHGEESGILYLHIYRQTSTDYKCR